jgi:16S rRNA (guanine(527)-N(7))-methyltransferase RsmG
VVVDPLVSCLPPSSVLHLQSDIRSAFRMDTAHIAELLQPFLQSASTTSSCHSEPSQRPVEEPAVLSPAQLRSISTYIDILLRWNARINLTAIRAPEDIVTRHFGESLFAARHLFPVPSTVPSVAKGVDVAAAASVANLGSRGSADPAGHPHTGGSAGGIATGRASGSAGGSTSGRAGGSTSGRAALEGRVNGHKEIGALAPASVADIGSGAGFPGLPIKLWAPHISLTLIESNHKKAAFLREVTRALTLTDVNIQNARAETLISVTYDVVTLRAVERFESILPVAANLVAPGGLLALLISSTQQSQARSTLPNFAWSNHDQVPESHSRILLVAGRPIEA